MTQPRVVAVDWAARRLAVEVDEAFEDVVARYEAAVPVPHCLLTEAGTPAGRR